MLVSFWFSVLWPYGISDSLRKSSIFVGVVFPAPLVPLFPNQETFFLPSCIPLSGTLDENAFLSVCYICCAGANCAGVCLPDSVLYLVQAGVSSCLGCAFVGSLTFLHLPPRGRSRTVFVLS